MGEGVRQYELVVVDDDAIVRTWVRSALEGTEFRIAGEGGSGAEALELVARRGPDVLLVDQILPDWMGSDLVHELRRRGCDAPSLLMTAAPREGLNERARAAGLQGTVVKSAEPAQLLAALRRVVNGEIAFEAPHPPAERQVVLSPREREILQLIGSGLTNIEIGDKLGIGRETVKTMLYRACGKLGVRRRSEAVAEAQRLGLLARPPHTGR